MSQLCPREKQKSEKKQKKQNKSKQPKRILWYKYRREMQAQPPRHRPYDKHLREQVVHLYCVSGVKCSAIARWFSGRPGLQGASCSPRAPGLEGFSPLPQKAWCGGCPAAGVYCAGHAGLTHACIAHPLPCLHAHPWQGRPGRTPSCLHNGHPLSCSIHCLVAIALQRLCCHCPCSAPCKHCWL